MFEIRVTRFSIQPQLSITTTDDLDHAVSLFNDYCEGFENMIRANSIDVDLWVESEDDPNYMRMLAAKSFPHNA